MQTFLNVNFAMLPFAIFSVLTAYQTSGIAIMAGLATSLLTNAWRLYRNEQRLLERATLAIFVLLSIGFFLLPEMVGTRPVAFAFLGLSIFAAVTVFCRRPWTAEFSRAENAGATDNPAFISINMFLSAVWAVLFLLIALANAIKAGAVATAAIVVVGAVLSSFGPGFLIRRALSRRIAEAETYRWRPPSFGEANGSDFDVAVVGAGIGGLTAAALLADAGLNVLVAEQHFQAGGFCQTFRRNVHHEGTPRVYRFDAGPHDISGVWDGGPVTAVLERLGVAQQVEWRRVEHTYRYPDMVIDVPADWRSYVAELGCRFPAERAGFETLFATIAAIRDGMYSPLIGTGGIPALGMTVDGMRAFPKRHPIAMQWLDKPFDQLVALHLSDPKARELVTALAGYIGDEAEPFTCAQMVPLFNYYFHGGYHPVGGCARLADALVAAIKQRGGQIRLNSPVEKITVVNGHAAGVKMADGSSISARAVVTNADLKRTFLELIDPAALPADFRAGIAAAKPALSAFTVHLGIDFVPDIRPAVYLKGDRKVGMTAMSLIDPTAAPAGHATLTLTHLVPTMEAQGWFPPNRDWNEWRQSPDYVARKKVLGDELIAIAETIIPGLSNHIVYRDEASPVTFGRYDWSSAGAIYGAQRGAWSKGVKSPIAGLVMAGSATHGPGVEAALISGAFAADALLPGLLASKPPKSRAS